MKNPHRAVRARGIGFFDYLHGQTGVVPNGHRAAPGAWTRLRVGVYCSRRTHTNSKHYRPPMDAVMPRLRQVVLDTTDARRAAEFWRQLLGLTYRPGHERPAPGQDDEAGCDWLNLRLPDGTPLLAFQQVSELKPATWPEHHVPQQLHLDLTVRDVEELKAVHEQVLRLGGAARFDGSDDVDEPLRVFTDPDGHPFCVFVSDG